MDTDRATSKNYIRKYLESAGWVYIFIVICHRITKEPPI